MTWSHTRLTAYDDCKYQWYLKYILYPGVKNEHLFFSTYGKTMHELIASYLKGEYTKEELQSKFVKDYSMVSETRGLPSLITTYFDAGLSYLKNMEFPKGNILEVEGSHNFNIGDIKMTGIIDLVLENENGELMVVDHKSSEMKPRSKRKKPTKTDELLDKKLKQLYIYAIPVEEKYGKLPDKLCFNCFRKGGFIEEPFVQETFEETKQWVKDKVDEIAKTTSFYPETDYFFCRYLCDRHDYCDFWLNA